MTASQFHDNQQLLYGGSGFSRCPLSITFMSDVFPTAPDAFPVTSDPYMCVIYPYKKPSPSDPIPNPLTIKNLHLPTHYLCLSCQPFHFFITPKIPIAPINSQKPTYFRRPFQFHPNSSTFLSKSQPLASISLVYLPNVCYTYQNKPHMPHVTNITSISIPIPFSLMDLSIRLF